MKDDSRIAWGVSLLVFGFLFLLKQLSIFSPEVENYIFDFRNLPFAFGLIFLIAHKNKSIGIVSIVVGILFYLKDIIIWTKSISEFIWPILLIGAGIIILFSAKKKKVESSDSTEIVPSKDKET